MQNIFLARRNLRVIITHIRGTCAVYVAIFSLVLLVECWTSWNCEIYWSHL
jgi:hypothetical protein